MVLFYINHQGEGTKLQANLTWLKKLWKLSDVHLLSKNCQNTRPMQSHSECSVSQKTFAWESANSQRSGSSTKASRSVYEPTQSSVWVMDRAKSKTEYFGQDVLACNWPYLELYAFPPLPPYGGHSSISNRVCNQCCWWPHSDQTRHDSICCLHYSWALHALYQPDYTTWN